LASILTNLRRYHLLFERLERLIFVNKIWPNDLKIGCKSPFNVIELLERDIGLEEDLEQFEVEFERDEVVEM
jgi:hypothetical protein